MRGAGRLKHKRDRRLDLSGENPMEHIGNLADIMLVFVCGLMVAIIMYWQVDLQNVTMVFDETQIIELEDAEQIEEQMSAFSEYDDMGTAYLDPKTGKVFALDEDGNP